MDAFFLTVFKKRLVLLNGLPWVEAHFLKFCKFGDTWNPDLFRTSQLNCYINTRFSGPAFSIKISMTNEDHLSNDTSSSHPEGKNNKTSDFLLLFLSSGRSICFW